VVLAVDKEISFPTLSRLVTRRILECRGTFFAAVFLWKLALLVLTAQPVPSNDAFFYDGPVVNLILHVKYCNPALAPALPISGTEVFCAYPPLYQLVLLGWMSVFGASAISAMVLHLVLFGICLFLLLAIFRELKLPAWPVHVAAAFLLVITFHDRPDSLAHVFGLAAVYAWVRGQLSRVGIKQGEVLEGAQGGGGWIWSMAAFLILGLATGLQIGGIYFLLIWFGVVAACLFCKEIFPFAPMSALVLIPVGLIALVAFGFPHLWAGFAEHARQTPSLTGLRVPRLAELLKMVRTVPGILAVAALLPVIWTRRRQAGQAGLESLWLLTLACTLAAMAIVGASMFVLTPNSVFFASHLQPLIVAGYLTLASSVTASGYDPARRIPAMPRGMRLQTVGFLTLALLGAVRAIGMSTWDLACATDVNYSSGIHRVRAEIDGCPSKSTVVLSSAFLYEAARHEKISWIHSDWMAPAQRGATTMDFEALLSLRPAKILLTQFDYFRRFETVLARLKLRPDLVQLEVTNTAQIPAPDSFPAIQKVVQHISWAPVVVTLQWR